MNITLAATLHDPDGRLYEQAQRILPILARTFSGLAIHITATTQPRTLALLETIGAHTHQETPDHQQGHLHLGKARRAVLASALEHQTPLILTCDLDRALHWAEHHYHELLHTCDQLPAHDLTILGRTTRALATHPRAQQDTETIINHVYATISGHPWDVTAAARGITPRAAHALLADCPDETIGVDVAWPLHIQRTTTYTLGYIETEGLEYETADRYHDHITAAGGLIPWLATIDADPHQWALRLAIARTEIESLIPYRNLPTQKDAP